MIGCWVAWKCLVACRFFESSQQPTCPQVLQSRKWTQVSPSLRHSSQPRLRGRLVRTKSKCRHCVGMTLYRACTNLHSNAESSMDRPRATRCSEVRPSGYRQPVDRQALYDRNAFMERRLQARLHILGAPVVQINGVCSPASASVRRRSSRTRRARAAGWTHARRRCCC
jgi:hypothetical protein